MFSRYCVLAYILLPFRMFMQPLRIAVTGTPGSGKTSFCNYGNINSIKVLDLAKRYDGVVEESLSPELSLIDVDSLNEILTEEWEKPPESNLFIDGHLSHNLPVDSVILLRCRPDVLESRLKNRNWSEEKIVENVECELLSTIAGELDDKISTIEIDTTNMKTSEIWGEVNEWLNEERKTQMLPIDWIAELHS
ncbi:MAG: hypothetical protein CMB48_05430 [Euryarchaeota archaeon]|nr:hypothetical protein [Euryarchaeota archaeon]